MALITNKYPRQFSRWLSRAIKRLKMVSFFARCVDVEASGLNRLGAGGYYQNIELPEGSTWSIYGQRKNALTNDADFYKNQLEFVKYALAEIGVGAPKDGSFEGMKFIDIGPAEGFHTIQILREGADLSVAIQPSYLLTERMKAILDIFRLRKNCVLIDSHFPLSGDHQMKWLKESSVGFDFVLCLGVIYHANNLMQFLDELLFLELPVVLEYEYAYPDANPDFDPYAHDDRANGFMNDDFVYDFIRRNGLRYAEISEYESYCKGVLNNHDNSVSRKMIVFSR